MTNVETWAGARSALPAYIPEFDALRGLAALAVCVGHFNVFFEIRGASTIARQLPWIGVELFFVLSGYLITNILLSVNEAAPAGTKFRWMMCTFYPRRACRILPLYYLVVCIFFVVSSNIRANALWFLTYTVNIGKLVDPPGSFAPLNHFWTLAVEEQFYVMWPFVVLFAKRTWLPMICVAGIVSGFLTRAVIVGCDGNSFATTQLTPCCLDPLLFGAYFAVRSKTHDKRQFKRPTIVIGAALTAFVLILGSVEVTEVLGRTAVSMGFAGFIDSVDSGFRRPNLWLLRLAPLRYVGTISYGLYVWHMPIDWLLSNWLKDQIILKFGSFSHLIHGSSLLVISLLVASISWFAFERPINALKVRFPYRYS